MDAGAAARPSRRRQFIEMMHHRAMHQVNECLNVCLLSPRSLDNWTCVAHDKRHFELYAKKSNTTQSVFFLGTNEIHCAFDEVYRLLNYQTTQQFRLVMQLLYGRNFRDGALLSTHAPRDYDDAYDVEAVQHSALWFTLQATRESLVGKDNSLAFFQALMVLHPDRSTANGSAQGDFARPSDTIQKRTLALAWLPFHRDDDEESGDMQQQESMRLKFTLIVEEVARARLKLSCVAMSFRDGDDLYQARSSSAARTIAKRLVNRSLSRLETAIIAARISRQGVVMPHQWVKNEDRVKCVICWKPFHSLLRRRHHCRLCGEVVCGSCCSLRSTNVFRDDMKKLEKIRVCHMCSNRGVSGNRGSDVRRYPPPLHSHTHSFTSPGGRQNVAAGLTMDDFVSTNSASRRRVPLLERPHDLEEDEEEEEEDAKLVGHDTCDSSASGGTGYFGYIGNMMGPPTTGLSSGKLISLRSMTRAELIARSNTTASRVSSSASSAHRATPQHRRSPRPWGPPPPQTTRGIRRAATPSRRPPPPIPTPFFGATPFRNPPPSPPSNGPFSLSFLHPSVNVPDRSEDLQGPMSIVADVGSNDRLSTVVNAASHERPSFRMVSHGLNNSGVSPFDSKPKATEVSPARYDPLRRTSMLSIGLLDTYRTSESDTKAPGAAGLNTTATTAGPTLDAVTENHRLQLMQLICSPACTLVDRVLMRACCERAALDCGVEGAFLARVEETHVVLEHVVGTANLSAIDHFLRHDTPCDYVLCTPPTERPFCITDCSNDERTRGMVMVKDVRMRFFAGVSIHVRGLPIACLCVFSEGEDDEEAVRLSRLSTSQYEFHVLEAAGQRISLELEHLVHGVEIA